jgi:hypothetical protein
LTATVQPTGLLAGMPTGTVTFTIDGAAQAPATLVNGTVMLSVYGLAPGAHSISVTYNGDATFATSTTTFTQIVTTAPTVMTLTSSVNPAAVGQAVTFTASVNSATSLGIPATGNVAFYSGATLLGYGTLSNGTATFTTNFAAGGSYAISALYQGNIIYSSSNASLTVVVAAPPGAGVLGSYDEIGSEAPTKLRDRALSAADNLLASDRWSVNSPWEPGWLPDDDFATETMLEALASIPDGVEPTNSTDC